MRQGYTPNTPFLGPFKLGWDQIQKLSETREDFNVGNLYIPREGFEWLLMLRAKANQDAKREPRKADKPIVPGMCTGMKI